MIHFFCIERLRLRVSKKSLVWFHFVFLKLYRKQKGAITMKRWIASLLSLVLVLSSTSLLFAWDREEILEDQILQSEVSQNDFSQGGTFSSESAEEDWAQGADALSFSGGEFSFSGDILPQAAEENGFSFEIPLYEEALVGDTDSRIEIRPYGDGSVFYDQVLLYGGHEYRLSRNTASFQDAQTYCVSQGGHLVTLSSQEENDAVLSLMHAAWPGSEAMIGLYDAQGSNGTWSTWVTGEPADYKNWGAGQPDWTDQTIAVLCDNASSTYNWQVGEWDNGYDGTYIFLCEWEGSSYDPSEEELTFEDDAFEEAVREQLGLDDDDPITRELCEEVDTLNVSELSIRSMKEISYFVNLVHLECYDNLLTSLDVSMLTKLEYLDCSDNELTKLDMRQNKSLEYLDVRHNAFASEADVLLPGPIETFLFMDEPEATPTPTPTPTPPPASLKLNKTSGKLYVGSSLKKLTLKATRTNLTEAVVFTSSKPSVATVSQKGVVTAKKKGTTVITASVTQYGQTYSATCKVTVKKPTLSVVSKATVKVGKKYSLKVKATPTGTVKYTSSDTSVATVNKNGVIKGVKKGKAVITVTCNKVTKNVKITVSK